MAIDFHHVSVIHMLKWLCSCHIWSCCSMKLVPPHHMSKPTHWWTCWYAELVCSCYFPKTLSPCMQTPKDWTCTSSMNLWPTLCEATPKCVLTLNQGFVHILTTGSRLQSWRENNRASGWMHPMPAQYLLVQSWQHFLRCVSAKCCLQNSRVPTDCHPTRCILVSEL